MLFWIPNTLDYLYFSLFLWLFFLRYSHDWILASNSRNNHFGAEFLILPFLLPGCWDCRCVPSQSCLDCSFVEWKYQCDLTSVTVVRAKRKMTQWTNWIYIYIFCINLHLYIMHVIATGINDGKENCHKWVISDHGSIYEFHCVKIVSMMFVFNGNFRVERLSQVYFLNVWQLRPKITLQKLYY